MGAAPIALLGSGMPEVSGNSLTLDAPEKAGACTEAVG